MNCPEHARLLDEFTAAVSEYLRLESAKIAAVIRGEDALIAEFEAAHKRKEVAKEAIREHMRQHGC